MVDGADRHERSATSRVPSPDRRRPARRGAEPGRRRPDRRRGPGATPGGRRSACVLALAAVVLRPGLRPEGAVLRRPAGATRRATPTSATPTCPTSTSAAGSPSSTWPYSDAIHGPRPLQRHGVPRRDLLLRLGHRRTSRTGCRARPNLADARGDSTRTSCTARPGAAEEPDLHRGQRDRLRPLRAARGVVPRRRQPPAALGRRALRRIAGAALRGPDQLGPARRRLRRGCPVGACPGPAAC